MDEDERIDPTIEEQYEDELRLRREVIRLRRRVAELERRLAEMESPQTVAAA